MEFPIFPLNGAVLFPKTYLPLNIFEKRYIEMVDYALSKQRIIGMIQTNNNGNLFKIGCLGKITNFNEIEDGRYLINLKGLHCFSTIKEISSQHNFRILHGNIIESDLNFQKENKETKSLITSKFESYIKIKKIKFNLSEINHLNAIELARVIAMVSPFDVIDKQMLLEINSINEFCLKIISILEIELSNPPKKMVVN